MSFISSESDRTNDSSSYDDSEDSIQPFEDDQHILIPSSQNDKQNLIQTSQREEEKVPQSFKIDGHKLDPSFGVDETDSILPVEVTFARHHHGEDLGDSLWNARLRITKYVFFNIQTRSE